MTTQARADVANLNRFIPTYRRNKDEVTGAVRVSTIEMVGLEQMPGGRFQVHGRTTGGAEYLLTPVYAHLFLGQEALGLLCIDLAGIAEFMPFEAAVVAPLTTQSVIADDDDDAPQSQARPEDPVTAITMANESEESANAPESLPQPLVLGIGRYWRRRRPVPPHASPRGVRWWPRTASARPQLIAA